MSERNRPVWLPTLHEAPPPKSDNIKLLTMAELARYVGRCHQVLRERYSEGVLPEPRHMLRGKVKTSRRFTLQEADMIKKIFDDRKWGDFATKRRRAKARKESMFRESTKTDTL